jgi:hypothetical protein
MCSLSAKGLWGYAFSQVGAFGFAVEAFHHDGTTSTTEFKEGSHFCLSAEMAVLAEAATIVFWPTREKCCLWRRVLWGHFCRGAICRERRFWRHNSEVVLRLGVATWLVGDMSLTEATDYARGEAAGEQTCDRLDDASGVEERRRASAFRSNSEQMATIAGQVANF